MTSSLRSIPPLVPPSRPKKQPSPRLNPRRSSSSSSSRRGNNQSPFNSRLMGVENNDVMEHNNRMMDNDQDGTAAAASPHATKSLSSSNTSTGGPFSSSIPTSPLKSTPRSLARREKQLLHQQQQQHQQQETDEDEGASATQNHPLSPPSAASVPNSQSGMGQSKSILLSNYRHPSGNSDSTSSPPDQDGDDFSAPLTPRNLVLDPTVPPPPEFTLTPPVSSPKPLIVSAKRLGNQVRRGNGAKRRRPAKSDNHSSFTSSSSDEDEDSNDMILPADMSPSKRTQEYWKRVYGTTQLPQQLLNSKSSWSASRAAPVKSCLSHSKPKRGILGNAQILMPPTSALLSSPPLVGAQGEESPLFSTPRSSPEDVWELQPHHKCSHNKSVQFGCAQAAEYEIDAPSARLTPLPPEFAQQRYPLTYKQEDNEEEEVAETKENSALLAEWEHDFDDFVDESDDEDEEGLRQHQQPTSSNKRHHSAARKQHSGSCSQKKHRKVNRRSDRRRSASFSSNNGNSKALFDSSLDDNNNDDDDFVESSTPPDEKQTNTKVLDTMASLSMTSPAQLSRVSNNDVKEQNDDMRPVNTQHDDDDDATDDDEALSPSAAEFQEEEAVSVMNVWEEAMRDFSVLEEHKNFDPTTVLLNAAYSPASFWNNELHEHSSPSVLGKFDSSETTLASLHSCMKRPIQKALDLLEREANVQTEDDETSAAMIPLEMLEQLERKARFDWQQLEVAFLEEAAQQANALKKEVAGVSCILDTITFPEESSRAPTYNQTQDTEQSIAKLEQMISEETKKKDSLQKAHAAATFQHEICHTTFSAICFHALELLCPCSMSLQPSLLHRALFGHMVEGLETNFALDGSGDNSVNRLVSSSSSTPKPLRNNHIGGRFCMALLCKEDGISLRECILKSTANAESESDIVLDLSVIMGRIDLAALSLQELTKVYEVSLNACSENGSTVIVVHVHLPRKTVLKVYYNRSEARGSFWSIPSDLKVEQDGKYVEEITPPFSLMADCRSLEATAGFLQAACENLLEKLAGQVTVA